MNTELEDALRRTLADAADRAPKAPPGLAAAPNRSHGPRRAGLQIALAVAAVLAVGGGTAVLTRQHHPPAPVQAADDSLKTVRPPLHGDPPPIEKVWPAAAHRVPDRLPGGERFAPEVFLNDHTMVVSTESSFEKADALYRYDLRTHAAKQITRILTPPGTKVFASGVTAGGGYIAWWMANATTTQIWSVPAAGGTPRRIVSQSGGGITRLAIDGTDVVWSGGRPQGVYRAPLTGGTPRMVKGSAGMHILAWPWIGSPYGVAGFVPGDEHATLFKNVRNALTGQTRTARTADNGHWACGVTWCVAGEGGLAVERRDGSGRIAVRGKDWPMMMRQVPVLGRFVLIGTTKGLGLYDMKSGRVGELESKRRNVIRVIDDPAKRLYYTDVRGGYLVVDMGAIA